jgi:hypothetical protein
LRPISAQISTHQQLVGASINFHRNNFEALGSQLVGGTIQNYANQQRITSFRFAPSVAYVLRKNWIVGLGVGVQLMKDEINPRGLPSGSGFLIGTLRLTSESTTRSFAPFLMAEYFRPLGEKFYLGGAASVGAEFSRTETTASSIAIINPGPPPTTSVQSSTSDYETRAYFAQFSPTLRYQLARRFGLRLSCGGFRLSEKTNDTRFADYQRLGVDVRADFDPQTWELGAYFNF